MRRLSLYLFLILTLLLAGLPALAQHNDLTLQGTINDEVPFVEIPVYVEQDNSLLRITMLPISGNLDTLLYLVDQRGFIVAENDDRTKAGASSGSYIEFAQAAAGEYTIIATRFNVTRGRTSGDFELRIELSSEGLAKSVYDVSEAALLEAGFPPIEPRPMADWTILAYYGGDTNLEAGILDDFKEFELAGGSSDQVRIVLLLDRHPQFSQASGNWTTARIFEVDEDQSGRPDDLDALILDTTPLADLGDFDSGDGENFARFLTWGTRNFPAKNYVLALASHGAGWEGIITDYSTGNILTLPELRQALATVRAAVGIERFALLINDACLMSSVEYHAVMREVFDYSLASPEIVVNPALDMTLFAQSIKGSPADIDLSALGQVLINTYMQRDVAQRRASDREYLTNALVDLNQFQAVEKAVEAFAAIINEAPERHVALLGAARQAAYVYTGFLNQNTLIDAGSFMREVVKRSTDARVLGAAQDVLRALRASLTYSESGGRASRHIQHSYHNIYFPGSRKLLSDTYFLNTSLPEWSRMLRNYYNALTPRPWTRDNEFLFHPPIAPLVTLSSVYPREKISVIWPVQADVEIIGRKIFSGAFFADQIQPDGQSIRYSFDELTVYDDRGDPSIWASGVDQVTFQWDTLLSTLSDGQNTNPELALITEDMALIEARYQPPDTDEWYDIALLFDAMDGDLQSIISRDANSEALGVLIDLPQDSRLQVYQSIVTSDGVAERSPGNTYQWDPDKLRLSWEPAPDGLYRLGFLVHSFGGETALASVDVRVEQPAEAAELRGYTDILNGFNLQFPREFSTPEPGSDRTLTSIHADETLAFHFYPVELPVYASGAVESGDFFRQFEAELPRYSVEEDTLISMRVGNQAGYAFLLVDANDDEYQAYALPIYEYRWLVFWIEGDPEDPNYQTLETILLERSSRFDAEAIAAERQSLWDIRPYGSVPEIRLPVRRDWEKHIRDDGYWLVFNAPDARSFFRIALFEGSDANQLTEKLLAEEIRKGSSRLTVTESRNYYGEFHLWRTTLYQVERQGEMFIGRLYVLSVPDSADLLTVWFETAAAEEERARRIETILEPMLDGLHVPSLTRTVRLEELGITLAVPRTWMSPETDPSDPTISISAADFSETLVILVLPDAIPANIESLVQSIASDFELEAGDLYAASYGGKAGLEFALFLDDDLAGGKGFITLSASPEDTALGFILIADENALDVSAEERFTQIMASLRFDGIAHESASQIRSQPARENEVALRWFDDRERGFYFPLPALWPTQAEIEFSDEGWLWFSPSGVNELVVDFLSDLENAEAAVKALDILPLSTETLLAGDVEILRFRGKGIAANGETAPVTGFAVPLKTSGEIAVIYYTVQADHQLEGLVDLALSGLGFYDRSEAVSEASEASVFSDGIRRYQSLEYAISFEYPEVFGPFSYDEDFEGDVSFSDDAGAITIALYEDMGLPLADYATASGYESLESFRISGIDGLVITGESSKVEGHAMRGLLLHFAEDEAVLEILILAADKERADETASIILKSLRILTGESFIPGRSARFHRAGPARQPTPPATPQVRSTLNTAQERSEFLDYMLGFSFAFPANWTGFVHDPVLNTYTTESPDERLRLTVRIVHEEITNLASFVEFHYPLSGAVQPDLRESILIAQFEYRQSTDETAQPLRGRGAAFYLETAQSAVVITLESTAPEDLKRSEILPTPLDLAYEELIATLSFGSEAANVPALDMPLRQFMNSEYGFTVEYPLLWDNMRYDPEIGGFTTLSEGTTEAMYVYVVTDHDGTLESVLEALVQRMKMQPMSAPVPVRIAGMDGLAFSVTYKYNGIWYGRCVAALHGTVGLVFSVEALEAPEDAERLFQAFVTGFHLLPESRSAGD